MRVEKPVTISPEVAAKCSGPDQFERFDNLVGRLLSVPKSVILEREARKRRRKNRRSESKAK